MLCIKYSNRTEQPCPRCHVLLQFMKHSTICNHHTVEETKNALHDYEAKVATPGGWRRIRPANALSMKEEANNKLDDASMYTLMPVLRYFPSC